MKKDRGVCVSVIVPTYNRPKLLHNALQSILDQTFTDFEIIVVNDGGKSVAHIVDALNRGNKITYIQNKINLGVASARNKAIEIACGKYIAYLDDDDIYYPEHLEILVTFIRRSNFNVAYTDAYRINQKYKRERCVVVNRLLEYSQDFNYDYILVGNFIPTLCVMHAKQCFDQVGLFDEKLQSLSDWDMWLRMSRRYRFAHIAQITCEYSRREKSDHITWNKKIKSSFQTTAYIYSKNRNFSQGRPDIQKQQSDFLNRLIKNRRPHLIKRVFKKLIYLADRLLADRIIKH